MNRRTFLIFALAALTVTALLIPVNAQKHSVFKPSDVSKVEITASKLNVRSGPGLNFNTISVVKKGALLDVIGMLGEWYLVHLPDDSIGVISNDYVKANSEDPINTMLTLINNTRKEYGIAALDKNDTIMEVAKLKAEDMATNNYLSHNSPTYGSPFTMLKKFGVTYKAAGENIAGNKSIENAHQQFIKSKSHLANIINARFKKIGIGIAEDEKYGKIIVQLFVE